MDLTYRIAVDMTLVGQSKYMYCIFLIFLSMKATLSGICWQDVSYKVLEHTFSWRKRKNILHDWSSR